MNRIRARDDRLHVREDIGSNTVAWGLPRTTGRLHAYLLLQPQPVSLDQMAIGLGIAKSGASAAARQLLQRGLARAMGQRGGRRRLYAAIDPAERGDGRCGAHVANKIAWPREALSISVIRTAAIKCECVLVDVSPDILAMVKDDGAG